MSCADDCLMSSTFIWRLPCRCVAVVEAVTVEDVCKCLEVATHVGLVALAHVLEHFVDGLLDGVELLVYLRDCGCMNSDVGS